MPHWQIWLSRVLTVGWIILLWWLSDRPEGPALAPPLDKVAHAAYFGVMAYLIALGWGRRGRRFLVPGTFLLIALIATMDESHQSFVPGRDANLKDFGANLAGACLALLAYVTACRQGFSLAKRLPENKE